MSSWIGGRSFAPNRGCARRAFAATKDCRADNPTDILYQSQEVQFRFSEAPGGYESQVQLKLGSIKFVLALH
jgi:hypothetical protein